MVSIFKWPFDRASEAYALLFPCFLQPMTTVILTCETYLIVVIAFERFCSVCRPHSHRARTASLSSTASLARYVLPVLVLALITNLPKFFEARIVFPTSEETAVAEMFGLENAVKITYEMTELRDNPNYIRFY